MKKAYKFGTILTLLFILVLSSCDDSGITPIYRTRGNITLSQNYMKRLDPNVDGVYELWIRTDEGATQSWYSLGKFNIGLDGKTIVNLDEQAMTFKYYGDTSKLDFATNALITIEDLNINTAPGPTRFLSTTLGVNSDSVYGKLYLGGQLAFDAVGRNMYTAPAARYTLQTPSTGQGAPECFKGLWFASITGDTALIPDGLALTPGNGWTYQAWLADTSTPGNPIFYSMGRFYDPHAADTDRAGPCSGPNPGYNAPGQDWVLSGCPSGKPEIVNISAGYYQVLITIEPEKEIPLSPAYEKPFVFFLFRQEYIVPSLGCKRVDNAFNFPRGTGQWPEARLKISN